MFGTRPVFSDLVSQFDASLNSLTWNDGKLIQHLTGQAKMAKPADAAIIVACINFRIIRVRIHILLTKLSVAGSGTSFALPF